MPTDRWHGSLSLAVLVALLSPMSAQAGTPPASSAHHPLDVGLLEFLGSADPAPGPLEADDGSWMIYLSKLKLGKVAKGAAPATVPATKPAAKPASTTAGPEGTPG